MKRLFYWFSVILFKDLISLIETAEVLAWIRSSKSYHMLSRKNKIIKTNGLFQEQISGSFERKYMCQKQLFK